jgi:hypothetical protein
MDSNDTPPRDEAGRFLGDHIAAEHARLEFTPLADERPREDDGAPTYFSDDNSIRAAAAEMQAKRGVETEEPEAIQWFARDTGEPLDPNISTSKEQAADALSAYRVARDTAAQDAQDRDLKAAIDNPRIELEVTDPSAAAQYGFKNEITRAVDEFARDMGVDPVATQPTMEAAPEQPARDATPGLDPEVERALQHPQIRAAVEQELAQAAQAQQQYAAAIEQANNFAQANLITEHLPELARLSRDQWESAIMTINAQPEGHARVQRAMGAISRVAQLSAEQARLAQEHQARSQAQRNAEIEKWSEGENRKYEQFLAREGLTLEQVQPAVQDYVSRTLGMSRAELARVVADNPILRGEKASILFTHAAKWAQAEQARKNIVAKPLPPAVRPGAQAPGMSANSNAGKIAALTKALDSATGMAAIRIASQLTSLRRKG